MLKTKQKGFSTTLVVIIVLVVVAGGVLAWQYWPKQVEPADEGQPETEQPADGGQSETEESVINEQDLDVSVLDGCQEELLYKTNLIVKDMADAQDAFQQYIDYMNVNGLEDMNFATDWKFEKVEYVGRYKGLSYWLITYKYSTNKNFQEGGRSQNYVNQNGDILNFLCMPPDGDAFNPPNE